MRMKPRLRGMAKVVMASARSASPFPYQPPVIVLAAPQAAPAPAPQWPHPQTVDSVGYPVRQALPGPGAPAASGGRVFKVVGEKEEYLDEW